MTAFDYVVVAVLGASILLGAWRGLFSEILALAAWIAAFFTARAVAPSLEPAFSGVFREPALQYVSAFVVIFVCILIAIAFVRFIGSKFLKAIGLGPLDRFLGAVFGVARGALVILLAVLLGGLTPLPQHLWWREAWLAPPFETAVILVKPWLPEMVAKRIKYR